MACHYWLLLATLLLYVGWVDALQCVKPVCSTNVGDPCTNYEDCSPNLWCDKYATNQCKFGNKLKFGEICNTQMFTTGACLDGLFCYYNNTQNITLLIQNPITTCQVRDSPGSWSVFSGYNILPGDTCNRDYQCTFYQLFTSNSFREDHMCIEGKCRHAPLGGQCQSSFFDTTQCTRGSYCASNSTCVVALPDRANCTDSFQCQSGACNVNKTCVGIGSQIEGESCYHPYECKEGHYCTGDGLYQLGVCKVLVITSTLNQPCNYTNDCTISNNEKCTCTRDGVSVCSRPYNAPGLFAAEQALKACAALHCGPVSKDKTMMVSSRRHTQNTCVILNCYEQMLSLYSRETEGDNSRFDCMLPPGEMPVIDYEYKPPPRNRSDYPPLDPPTFAPSNPPAHLPTYPPNPTPYPPDHPPHNTEIYVESGDHTTNLITLLMWIAGVFIVVYLAKFFINLYHHPLPADIAHLLSPTAKQPLQV